MSLAAAPPPRLRADSRRRRPPRLTATARAARASWAATRRADPPASCRPRDSAGYGRPAPSRPGRGSPSPRSPPPPGAPSRRPAGEASAARGPARSPGRLPPAPPRPSSLQNVPPPPLPSPRRSLLRPASRSFLTPRLAVPSRCLRTCRSAGPSYVLPGGPLPRSVSDSLRIHSCHVAGCKISAAQSLSRCKTSAGAESQAAPSVLAPLVEAQVSIRRRAPGGPVHAAHEDESLPGHTRGLVPAARDHAPTPQPPPSSDTPRRPPAGDLVTGQAPCLAPAHPLTAGDRRGRSSTPSDPAASTPGRPRRRWWRWCRA